MPSLQRFCDAMRWAADSDQVGYSQSDRWDVEFFGSGSYNADCSSLVIQALRYAGFDTGDATYTGNMRHELCARGWKVVVPNGSPQAGDILLNDGNHVAAWLGDCLAQASIDENGNIAGGARGDQTGQEVNTRGYYSYPWDCYLRYTGESDVQPTEGDLDMAECIFYCDEAQGNYKKGDVVYWSAGDGFAYLDHPDCINLLKQCHPGIAEIHTSNKYPWLVRAKQATITEAAKATYGKRD